MNIYDEHNQAKAQAIRVIANGLLPFIGMTAFPDIAAKMQDAFLIHTERMAGGLNLAKNPELLEVTAKELFILAKESALQIAGRFN